MNIEHQPYMNEIINAMEDKNITRIILKKITTCEQKFYLINKLDINQVIILTENAMVLVLNHIYDSLQEIETHQIVIDFMENMYKKLSESLMMRQSNRIICNKGEFHVIKRFAIEYSKNEYKAASNDDFQIL